MVARQELDRDCTMPIDVQAKNEEFRTFHMACGLMGQLSVNRALAWVASRSSWKTNKSQLGPKAVLWKPRHEP